MIICKAEGLSVNETTLQTVAAGANGDIRLVLGQLQMIRLRSKTLSYDDAKVRPCALLYPTMWQTSDMFDVLHPMVSATLFSFKPGKHCQSDLHQHALCLDSSGHKMRLVALALSYLHGEKAYTRSVLH